MKKTFVRSAVVILTVLFLTGFAQSALANNKVTLKAVHFLPSFMEISKDFIELTKRISTASGGELEIKILGGPDVFAPPAQADALRKGIIDCLMCPTEYYKQLLPEATTFHLGLLTAAEERETGFYDYMKKRHAEFGVYYVGRTRAADPFFVYLKKPIAKPEDLAGLKIGRSAPLASNLYKSFGATHVTVQAGGFYSALERGVVDGVGHPCDGITGLSLGEVSDYLLNEPVYPRNSTVFLMNLKKYESLPDNLKKIINDNTIAWENERIGVDDARIAKTLEIAKEKGFTFINFSKEDSKKFADRAFQVEWDVIKEKQPERYDTLRKLLKQQP